MKRYRADAIFYHIGKVLWIPVVIGGFWLSLGGLSAHGDWFACYVKKLTGFPCPGCGGTRAVSALFSGNLIQSFLYHPAVSMGALAYLHFMGLCFFRKHIKKSREEKEIPIEPYVYGAVVVILAQWIVKLLLMIKK